ncbi:MAG: hypothetical protein FJ398_08975 [Verrucomicrobia bacterium]|nr:hypothetical protein [Verrucomicrobiota bacterium]
MEEKQRLHDLLLERIKQRSGDLENMWKEMNAHWTYEDPFYRFYHGSYKVCGVQQTTARAVELLRRLMPDRPLDATFEEIIRQGTGKKFAIEHNKDWDNHTRPMLEAFTHAKFMIEMCLRYRDLPKAPTTLPSGWAALLYLYGLR